MLTCCMSIVFRFFGDHENCCNNKAEKAGLTDMSDLLECCLCKSCTKSSASNWSWMHLTVTSVGDSVVNSCNSCLWTLHSFSNFQYSFKTTLNWTKVKHFATILFPTLNSESSAGVRVIVTIIWVNVTLHQVNYILVPQWKRLVYTYFETHCMLQCSVFLGNSQ